MFRTKLVDVSKLYEACEQANIDDEDSTTLTADDLAYELELLEASIKAKQLFIENRETKD